MGKEATCLQKQPNCTYQRSKTSALGFRRDERAWREGG